MGDFTIIPPGQIYMDRLIQEWSFFDVNGKRSVFDEKSRAEMVE